MFPETCMYLALVKKFEMKKYTMAFLMIPGNVRNCFL